MKPTRLTVLALLLFSGLCGLAVANASASGGQLCLIPGFPPDHVGYSKLRKLKAAKGTYGSVEEVVPQILEQAKALNADAIIRYRASQKFGFWPWRFVRPVATGIAIKWTAPERADCGALGGKLSS